MERVVDPIQATQHFDAGLIFLSYVISVIGAQTTLELLGRRTSVKGAYNLFLLCGSALAMGSVGIWSMHFIGNNALKLSYNNTTYQLVYAPGFTFISLLVAIICMFLSFAFVCSTEQVLMTRIVFSGVIAGAGVVVMHYVGQYAIMFFVVHYSVAYIVGAALIGIGATTTALSIFFRLRAQWENQWYKRLGCSMIMGLAVCGMHYVAMVGTTYEVLDPTATPPVPALTTTALIIIIAAIVIVTCVGLISIQIWQSKILLKKSSSGLVVIDAIYFDSEGKLMVKDDGTVPMSEIHTTGKQSAIDSLTVTNPLFTILFKLSLAWETRNTIQKAIDEEHHVEFLQAFDSAAGDLAAHMKINHNDVGTLYDGMLSSGTQKRRSRLRFMSPFDKVSLEQDSHNANEGGSTKRSSQKGTANTPTSSVFDMAPKAYKGGKHLFLVRKIPNSSAVDHFTAQGFRFSDPSFIAQRIAAKLSVPEDYMLWQLREMQMYADQGMRMSMEIDRPIATKASSGVYMGLLVLIEGATPTESPSILVNRDRRFCLPIVQLKGEDVAEHRGPLKPSEKAYLANLQFSTMLDTIIPQSRSSTSNEATAQFLNSSGTPALHFMNAFQQAAKTLANKSTYSHLIASRATLHRDVIEMPAFSLTHQPCQLILYKAYIISPEIAVSINSSSTDEVKCLSLPLYRSIWEATTQEAIQSYLKKRQTAVQAMTQRQLYVTQSVQSNYSYEVRSPESDLTSLTSLPPPPRARRSRTPKSKPVPNTKLGNFLGGKLGRENSDGLQEHDMTEFTEMMPILPTAERFQWLEDVIDEMTDSF
ncbi:hypothetical protein BC943DRAFT_357938 [Umbelopsis sp. AD052]|nr:hypothetical protein BC943DRAFT_357938 [Umbelopsis sp. AD052]